MCVAARSSRTRSRARGVQLMSLECNGPNSCLEAGVCVCSAQFLSHRALASFLPSISFHFLSLRATAEGPKFGARSAPPTTTTTTTGAPDFVNRQSAQFDFARDSRWFLFFWFLFANGATCTIFEGNASAPPVSSLLFVCCVYVLRGEERHP